MKLQSTAIVVGALMVAAAVLAVSARPTEKIADDRPKVDLESIVPTHIGDWRVDPTIVPLLPTPDAQAVLERIYTQTLARTYVNGAGQRVMLSIAYGGNQSDSLQVHAPEVCYAAQGFEVARNMVGQLATQFGSIPVKRLIARKGARNEPITYWITVGDHATVSGFRQKLAQLRYGLSGKIPDGMLVRVSTIGSDLERDYAIQEGFIRSLLSEMKATDRVRLAGSFGA